MTIRIIEARCLEYGLKQTEKIYKNILSVSDVDGNLCMLTKDGQSACVNAVFANPDITGISIIKDKE